ncbi:MAG: DUF6230 family protein [Solirubrobacterales bacterium]
MVGLNMNKRWFFMSGGAGMGVLVVLLSLLVFTGTAFAAFPMAGVGGFVVHASKIVGQNFELIPSVTDTNDSSVSEPTKKLYWPCSQTAMAIVDIDGLEITKVMNIGLLMPGKTATVKVTAANGVHGTGLVMQMSGLECTEAYFGQAMEMDENMTKTIGGTEVVPSPISALGIPIGMNAPRIELANADINTHNMKAATMRIPSMKLSVDVN